jgi:hypothetical protein
MDRPQPPGRRTIWHPHWPRRRLLGRRALCEFWDERDAYYQEVEVTAEIQALCERSRVRCETLYHSGAEASPAQSEAFPAAEKEGQP